MRRTRRKQKGAGGHLSDTNLLLVPVGGLSRGSPSRRSALSSSPEQQRRAVSSRSRRQPRGGCARVCGLDPGKPQTSRTSPSAAARSLS